MTEQPIIIGMGKTGLAFARFAKTQGITPVAVCDTRGEISNQSEFDALFPDVPIHLGALDPALLAKANVVWASPGVALTGAFFDKARAMDVAIFSDVAVFLQHVGEADIVAVTGTNGKSTVVSMLGAMVEAAGRSVIVAGNIGLPVLETFSMPAPDVFVLELSSYQLASTPTMRSTAAVILNIAADHLEWHSSMDNYLKAKQVIYRHCKNPVVNVNAVLVWESLGLENVTLFGRDAYDAASPLSAHDQQNAQAAMALGDAIGLPAAAMQAALHCFKGLPHRCERVAEREGVRWINDSKATNVAASCAAIESFSPKAAGSVILIAGGKGKGEALSAWVKCVRDNVSAVLLIGEMSEAMADALGDSVVVYRCNDLPTACEQARSLSKSGDVVLFSPACSSFDQFANFEKRGEAFVAAIQ